MKKILILLMMSMLLLACGDKGKDTLNTLNGSLVCVMEESGVVAEQIFNFKNDRLENIIINTSMTYELLGMSEEDINSSAEEELEALNDIMKEILGADADSKLEFTETGINLTISVSKEAIKDMGITDIEYDKVYDQAFIDDLIVKYESEGGTCKFNWWIKWSEHK